MAHRVEFTLVFAPEAMDHLGAIERKYHRLIQQAIVEQLSFTPEKGTRNRKPLEQPAPFGSTWELRCGPHNRFRVFYEVNPTEWTVHILAIGMKDRNRLIIGGMEFKP